MCRPPARLIITGAALLAGPAFAIDDVPTTTGLSGFVLAGPGYFTIASNQIATGAPLLDDVGVARIESIFARPSSQSSPALIVAGEINYTFGKTRTQLFLGNRLEDLLRLDVIFGIGARQRLRDGTILAASVLLTPLELKVWKDPFVEGEDRQKTDRNLPGFRLRAGRILRTGLELTADLRRYRYDDEKSGDWLIEQGRLDPAQQPLLIRDGNVFRFKAIYRFDWSRHRFEPAIRYTNDAHDGGAVANRGFGLQVTYLYLTPKVVLDANVIYGRREADAVHPVYGVTHKSDRFGAVLLALLPVKRFDTSGWSVFGGVEFFREDANIDFYDGWSNAINAGLVWRHRRP